MGEVVVCPLCIHFEPEIFGDYFVVAKCGHYFHHHCIMKVINRGVDRCPLNCKIPISPKKLTKLFGIDPNASSCSYSSSRRSSITSYANVPVSTYDYCFKIALLGNSGVGKSCLMRRFTEDIFMENIQSTPGVDLVRKIMTIGGKIIHLIIWDTAGQEAFNSIISTCVRDVQGIIFVYDSTRPESLDNITSWMDFANDYGPKDTIKILVGNKTDKKDKHAVSESYGKAVAESMGMSFIETSAKDAINVETAFRILTGKILESEWILAAVKDKNKLRSSTIRLDDDSYNSEGDTGCGGWFKKNFDIALENISKGLRFMGIHI